MAPTTKPIPKRREVTRRRARKEGGTSVLEFSLIFYPMLLLMLGIVIIGYNLGQAVQVAQIARDADSMYSRGAPMYSSSAQNFLAQLGSNMGLQTSSGNGLVTLSKIQFIPDPASCGSGPSDSRYANCTVGTNRLVQRITIGNTGITAGATRFPTAGTVSYDSLDQVNNYLTDNNAIVSNFSTTLQLKPLEVSYVSEAYFQTSSVTLGNVVSTPGVYAQAFF
ncbi:MAG TPA: TadE family protein [Bryobacteraceae bacterium]|nr:TadE family protein [Bryobacteraceae bacterium]